MNWAACRSMSSSRSPRATCGDGDIRTQSTPIRLGSHAQQLAAVDVDQLRDDSQPDQLIELIAGGRPPNGTAQAEQRSKAGTAPPSWVNGADDGNRTRTISLGTGLSHAP